MGGDRVRKEHPSEREMHVQKACGERKQSTLEDLRGSECLKQSMWNGSRLEAGKDQTFIRSNLYNHLSWRMFWFPFYR